MKGKGENRSGRDARERNGPEAFALPSPKAKGLGRIPPAGHEPGSIGGEGEGEKGAAQGEETMFQLPFRHRPQMEPAAVIPGGQDAAVRGEREGMDALLMTFEDTEQTALRDPPDSDVTVVSPRGQEVPLRRERQPAQDPHAAPQTSKEGPFGKTPEADPSILPGGGQHGALRGEGEGVNRTPMPGPAERIPGSTLQVP